MGVETVASKANCALRDDARQYGLVRFGGRPAVVHGVHFPLRLSMIAETAVTTRTTTRLMTATVLALTAGSAALRAASLDHLVGAADEVAPSHANCPLRTKPTEGSVVRHSNFGG